MNQSRPEDTGYNNPTRPSPSTRTLSDEERIAFLNAEVATAVEEEGFARGEEAATGLRDTLARVFGLGRGMIVFGMLLALFTALIGYVFAVDLYMRLETLPLFLQIPFWVLLALFVILVVQVLAQCLRLWWRLRDIPQVEIPRPLADATEQSGDGVQAARRALLPYLEAMKADRRRLEEAWAGIWPKSASKEPRDVLDAIDRLLDPGPVESRRWMEDFNGDVIEPLNRAADERIWHYTKIIGLKTAISPFALIDALAVLYNSARMLRDLALLFNRRLNTTQISILLGVVIFQTYVASQAQEVLESGAEEMSGFLSNSFARASGKLVGARVAEGTVNGLVARRLGRRSLRWLRPVARSAASPRIEGGQR